MNQVYQACNITGSTTARSDCLMITCSSVWIITRCKLSREVLKLCACHSPRSCYGVCWWWFSDRVSVKEHVGCGQKATCMLSIALGLQHLHTCGHMHGSISPHRILVSTSALHTSPGAALSGAGAHLRCIIAGMCLEPTITSVRREECRMSQDSLLMYYAPEIRSTTPDPSEEMDIWSCGVLFLWLSGALLPSMNTGRQHTFDRMDCSACAQQYRRLVASMVDLNPQERPSASDAVKALRAME
jgi:hypothetical protein